MKRLAASAALLISIASVALTGRADQARDELHAQFLNPPASARILKIIHSWPDTPDAQDRLIGLLKTQGFGGVVCNVSFRDYLRSDPAWKAFERAVRAARAAGLAMWLYDEKGYPSATAGGLVLNDHPEYQARGLLLTETNSSGAAVNLKLPPGELKLAAAFEVRDGVLDFDLSTNLHAWVQNGTLEWPAPPGSWRVMAVTESRLHEGTHADMSLSDHIPYPNLLERESTAKFLELTHAAYAKHLPEGLDNYFISTFTDEPSLMSLFLRPMPYCVIPWSETLSHEFARRRGSKIEPLIPLLLAEAGPAGRRARYGYWKTVGELVAENFFGQIQQWCAEHKILSGGHLLMEENLVNQVALYGDFFGCLRRLDAPSIDCLTSLPEQVPWYIGRLAASAAELEGKRVVMCETSDHSQRYRPPGDKRPVITVSKVEVRGTCNRLMLGGVNAITSYYTFAGLSEADLRELNEWVGRGCTLLAQSRPAADIAVLFPVESLWPRFTPSRHFANASPEAARIESVFHAVSEGLYTSGRDFLYVDSRALLEANVSHGALVHGKQQWRTVILPGADTLPLAAWEKLALFVRSGGVLISVALPPANSETEFPSAAVQTIAQDIFGKSSMSHVGHFSDSRAATNKNNGAGVFIASGEESLLPLYLEPLTPPYLSSADPRSPLRYTRRATDTLDLCFVINDGKRPWKGTVKLDSSGPGEEWNPATGKRRAIADPSAIELDLGPYDARCFVFDHIKAPGTVVRARASLSTSATLPVLRGRALLLKTPIVARGEFVREALRPMTNAAEATTAAWDIDGRITKSNVDTFLFARLEPANQLRLSDAQFLRFETSVPFGQKTGTQLLAILHERTGADYLASTGRWLNAPGTERTMLPLSRFQLAGWSADKNNQLDLEEVSEIRIGWGGYYGLAEEQIRFTLSAVEAVSTDGSR